MSELPPDQAHTHTGYQVDHLFVLVGENPLPAYVAARTLLRPAGTVYPVYSRRTEKLLRGLRATLAPHGFGNQEGERKIADVSLIASDNTGLPAEYDSYHIMKEITRVMDAIRRREPDGIIGLNYTSGTGPMGVHSYISLRDWYQLPDPRTGRKRPGPEPVFSYLNPRAPQMLIDRAGRTPALYQIELDVTLDELIQLHGLRRTDTPGKPLRSEAAQRLLGLPNKAVKSLNAWCRAELAPACRITLPYYPYEEWKSEEELARITLPLSESRTPLNDKLIPILREECGASDVSLPLGGLREQNRFPSIQDGCKWLEGLWLESYVLEQVNALAGVAVRMPIHSQRRSIVVPRDISERDRFEFDVAFVIGYQLFAISCTTSSTRNICKSKLMEAYVRARQLGGGEARIALVCMLNNTPVADDPESGSVQDLEKELKLVLEDDRIKVFGRPHLQDLHREMHKWIVVTRAERVQA